MTTLRYLPHAFKQTTGDIQMSDFRQFGSHPHRTQPLCGSFLLLFWDPRLSSGVTCRWVNGVHLATNFPCVSGGDGSNRSNRISVRQTSLGCCKRIQVEIMDRPHLSDMFTNRSTTGSTNGGVTCRKPGRCRLAGGDLSFTSIHSYPC